MSFIKQIFYPLLLIISCLIVYSTTFNFLIDSGGDSAQYVLLAESISKGIGYKTINSPGVPLHTQYPFLFPLLLSPIVFFLGYNLLSMHLLMIILGTLSIFVIYLIFKEYFCKDISLLLSILIAFTPPFYFLVNGILSEIPYLLFSSLTIYMHLKFQKISILRSSNFEILFMSIAILAAFFTRTIGISLFMAYIAFLIQKGELSIKELSVNPVKYLILALLALLIILWLFRGYMQGPGIIYLNQFFFIDPYNPLEGSVKAIHLYKRLINNISYYFNLIPYLYAPWISFLKHEHQKIVGFIVLFFPLIGFLKNLFFRRTFVEFYFLFYLFFIYIWFWNGSRFLVPIFPLFVLYFLIGLKLVLNFLNKYIMLNPVIAKNIFSILLITTILFPNINTVSKIINNNKTLLSAHFKKNSQENKFKMLFQKIGHLPEGSVIGDNSRWKEYISLSYYLQTVSKENGDKTVLCRKPRLTSLISGMKSVGLNHLPLIKNSKELLIFIEEFNIGYIIVDNLFIETTKYLIPLINTVKEKFVILKDEGNNNFLLATKDS